MRFAFVSTMADWPWGGSEELWSQTALELKRAGHDVLGSVVHRPQLSEKVLQLAKQGVRIVTHPSYRVGLTGRIWNKLTLRHRRSYKRLKQFRPDLVIISQGHNSGGFAWAKICHEAKIPYVLIVHCNSEHWWFEDRELEKPRQRIKLLERSFAFLAVTSICSECSWAIR